MKKRILCTVLAALLLTACSAGGGAGDPGSTDPASELDWVKACFFEYLKRENMVDPEYGPKTADELRIEKLVGTFGDGCVVAYIDVPGLSYTQAFRTEQYGAHTITFRDGQECYAFYQNEVYTIGTAYKMGLLSDADILKIDEAVGVREGYYHEWLPETADMLEKAGNGKNA